MKRYFKHFQLGKLLICYIQFIGNSCKVIAIIIFDKLCEFLTFFLENYIQRVYFVFLLCKKCRINIHQLSIFKELLRKVYDYVITYVLK